MRANLAQAVNDFPGLRDDLLKANSSIVGSAGIGSIIEEGTKAEIRKEKLVNKAVQDGWVSPEASDQEIDIALQNMRLADESKRNYDAAMETLSLERATIGLTKDQLDLITSKEKQVAKTFLSQTAPAVFDSFNVQAEKVLTALNAGDITEADAVQFIESQFVEFEQTMSTPLSQVDSHTAEATMKGYRQYVDILTKRARGGVYSRGV